MITEINNRVVKQIEADYKAMNYDSKRIAAYHAGMALGQILLLVGAVVALVLIF